MSLGNSGGGSTPQSSTMNMPQSQHFLLKWNNHRSNLVTVFENLLQGENLVDVTLAVEGKFLKAHKIVLSACSPYFQSMFVHQTPNEKHPILIFHDLKFNHLKTLLEFMYRGEISIDEKDLSEILKVAEALSIRGLSSFESDDEDGNSEQQQQQEKSTGDSVGSSNAASANNAAANSATIPNGQPLPQQQQQPPAKQNQTHHQQAPISNQQNDNQQTFYRHQNVCDAPSNGTMEVEEQQPKPVSTRGHSKKMKASHKVAFDAKTGLPIKKKRGRQPKNQSLSSSVELRPPILKPQESYVTDVKPVLTGKTSGVRRRIPKKYGLKREKFSQSSPTRSQDSEYRNFALTEDDSPDSPMELLNEPLSEGRLTEMSVRGLDLFRYASVEDGVYRCMECEKLHIKKSFKNKYSFQRHAFLYHEGNMRKVFPCSVCSREFSRPDKMKNHLRSIHQTGNGKASSPASEGSENSTPIGIASKMTDNNCDY